MDYRELLQGELNNPEFKKAWNDTELEYTVADLLIKLRSGAGLTQEELAKKVGTTQSAIARMESGRILPKLDSLSKIAKICGKNIEIVVR
ncbi:MAG TPA: helix-turn-helix transcriptional regulator [Spirochaetia bacterium]|nr:helix-turn-helix transcriptional regulator [Spirochaetia bacterium]